MPILKSGIIFFIIIANRIANCQDYKGFDDTIQFRINWPGKLDTDDMKNGSQILDIVTTNREKYQCYIPELKGKTVEETDANHSFSPLQLLSTLFFPQLCSYRVESYWTYEVCHGKYVRQYHEEREGKKVKLQEYYLGTWDAAKQKKLEEDMKKAEEKGEKPKFKKIEGLNLPYVEFEMSSGTLCDLNNKPRKTKVQYVCFSNRKHEVYTFKETSTCEYEVTILSPLLCAHPKYKPKDSEENVVSCLPVGNGSKKPRSLLAMEAESFRYGQKVNENKLGKDVLAVIKFEKVVEDGETKVKMELQPIDYDSIANNIQNGPTTLPESPSQVFQNDDLVRAFLDGENCLEGGTGWWKYDFCYGKHVKQVHVDDKDGFHSTVLLGEFIEAEHLAWLAENPLKKPKPKGQRVQISHFYSHGNICQQTKKPRQTEVKLKCLENASSPSQVSLYLLEPKICQYILGIESPLICEILDMADENGLIKWPPAPLTKVVDNNLLDEEAIVIVKPEKHPKKREEHTDKDYEHIEL